MGFFLLMLFPFLQVNAQTGEDQASLQQPSKLIKFDNTTNLTLAKSQQILKKELTNGQIGYEFTELKSESDRLGYTFNTFQETYKGLKVEFAIQKLHALKGRVTTLSGDFYEMGDLDTNPTMSAEAAFKKAVGFVGASHYLWENPNSAAMMDNYFKPSGELLILPDFDNSGKVNLAYKFDIYATEPLSRDHVYISANTGEVLMVNPIIKHLGEHKHAASRSVAPSFEEAIDALAVGNAATRYSGNRSITTRIISGNYALRDNTRGNGVNTYNSGGSNSYPQTNFFDNDNIHLMF